MAKFYPIKVLLPDPEMAEKIVASPVKSYTKTEIEKIIHQNPIHFLNIVYPAIGNFTDKNEYLKQLRLGEEKLSELLQKNVYQPTKKSAFYIYRQKKGNHSYTGIIGGLSIDSIANGTLKPHEDTLSNREKKLAEYLGIIDIHAEPVFITGPKSKNIDNIIDSFICLEPTINFRSDDNVVHQLWSVANLQDQKILQLEFKAFNNLYIADGHHRTASAIKFGKAMRKKNPNFTGKEPYNFFSAIYFPENEIALLEFNRLLKNVPSGKIEKMLDALSENFTVIKGRQERKNLYFYVYVKSEWLTIIPKKELVNQSDAEGLLPSTFLTKNILKPFLDIHDLRTDNRVEFLGGATNYDAIKKMVTNGQFNIAFVLPPVTFRQFRQFADNGWFMPPKSTWFAPKLPNGLIIYPLNTRQL